MYFEIFAFFLFMILLNAVAGITAYVVNPKKLNEEGEFTTYFKFILGTTIFFTIIVAILLVLKYGFRLELRGNIAALTIYLITYFLILICFNGRQVVKNMFYKLVSAITKVIVLLQMALFFLIPVNSILAYMHLPCIAYFALHPALFGRGVVLPVEFDFFDEYNTNVDFKGDVRFYKKDVFPFKKQIGDKVPLRMDPDSYYSEKQTREYVLYTSSFKYNPYIDTVMFNNNLKIINDKQNKTIYLIDRVMNVTSKQLDTLHFVKLK